MNIQALSPQGYNINDNPMNTNPFWDQELDPTALGRLEQAERDIDDLEQNKQDTLISGTNIKTINGQSVLGSGNIEIQGGGSTNAVWGQITGTLMNQTDLANMLATKANITAFNNYYDKSEIDSMIGDIQTILEGI